MFSFFQRNKVKTTYTKKGSHSKHWYGVYSHETEYDTLKNYFLDAVVKGQEKIIDKNITIIENPLVRAVSYRDEIITGFPHWKGAQYEPVETNLITEWSDSYYLEAVIQVAHASGCKLNFFATDYAFNKNTYKKDKNLAVNIVGFAYVLENFDVNAINNQRKDVQFSDNFCGYFPSDESDEINFIGKIHNIKEHTLSTIEGFIITVSLTPDLNLDVFIAKTNLKIDLSLNKHVTGLIWLMGTLEK
jgi:hypothetical protein